MYTKFISVTKRTIQCFFSTLFYYFFYQMINDNSCCWVGPSERCHKLNFYFFINFNSGRFWTTRKYNLPTPATVFLFLLWSSALLGWAVVPFAIFLLHSSKGYIALAEHCFASVACKKRSSVNSGDWLRTFDDVPGVVKTDLFRWAMRSKR